MCGLVSTAQTNILILFIYRISPQISGGGLDYLTSSAHVRIEATRKKMHQETKFISFDTCAKAVQYREPYKDILYREDNGKVSYSLEYRGVGPRTRAR